MYSRDQIADGLRILGVAAGDSILMHASVRAAGEIAGGPDQIHLAMKQALTAEGTLMMYASCPRYRRSGTWRPDPGARGGDFREIPCIRSAYSEIAARKRHARRVLSHLPGSRVNSHVARFVAWGKQ